MRRRSLPPLALRTTLIVCAMGSPSWAEEPASAPTSSDEVPPAEPDAAQSKTEDKVSEDTETSAPADENENEDAEPSETETAPATPEVDPYAEAKERVKRARKLYESENFDAALTEFQAAYDAMLGHPARPNVLYNIGRCQEGLYRYDAAIASYKKYLTEAGDDAPDRVKVESTIEALRGFLGTLVVELSTTTGPLPSSYEVWVDGRRVGDNVESFLVPGGNHTVEIRASGFESASQEVQLPARSEKTLSLSLAPLAKEYKGLSSTYFWTAGGLALVAGAVGGTFGVMALTNRSGLDSKESEAVTVDDVDGLESQALVADIFFVGAGVFATTATILAFMTDWSEDGMESSPVTVKEVGLLPVPQGAALSVGGSF